MRCSRMLLLLSLLATPGGPALSQEGGSRQRLKNGGFEQGLQGWKASRGLHLVEDAGQAHAGERCLVGVVRARGKGQVLRRTVDLHADRMYRLQIWARADNRNKLTVWRKIGEERNVVASWDRVPGEWRRYRVNFSVERDGPTVIGIVAPSSHDATPGRMWVDDIALLELKLIPEVEIAGGSDFHDAPVMAQAGERSAWAAWLTRAGDRERLEVALVERTGAAVAVSRRWTVDTGKTTGLLHPVIAAGGDGAAWLAWSAEQDDNWDVYAARLGSDGPRPAIRVTRHAGVDIAPAIALLGDASWIAWESNRDSARQIYVTALRGTGAEQPQRLSDPAHNSYAPALAATAPGALWAAWHAFDQGSADLFARRREDGGWSAVQRLTHAPGLDRDVALHAHGDALWLAWEHASYAGYALGRVTVQRVVAARLDARGLRMPAGLPRTRLWKLAVTPSLLVDDRGALWVAARVPRDRNSGWDVLLWRHAGKAWGEPRHLSLNKGLRRRPGLAQLGDRIAVLYQADDLPGRWSSQADSVRGHSGVRLAAVRRPEKPRRTRVALAPLKEPADPFRAAAERRRLGEGRAVARLQHGGRSFRLLFGDLHEHTDFSVCHRSRDEAPAHTYQMMRDILGCDFGASTDHGNNFNGYLWSLNGKLARANHDPGRFVTFLAQEWTSGIERVTPQHPFGYFGHRNLIHADPHAAAWHVAAEGGTPAELWAALAREEQDFVLIPHQIADLGNVPVDFGYHHETHQPVAEIFQMRGSYECLGCPRQARNTAPRGYFLRDAWERGVVIGVIASPDHGGGAGKAAVWARDNTRAGLFEALHARRTYGTTGARIRLDFRVNGHLMGEVGAPPDGPVHIKLRVEGAAPLRAVEVLRRSEVVLRAEVRGERCELSFEDAPPPGPTYYSLRVTQRDNEMAWSSPVWLGRLPRKRCGRAGFRPTACPRRPLARVRRGPSCSDFACQSTGTGEPSVAY